MMRSRLWLLAPVCLLAAASPHAAVAQKPTLDSRIEIRVEGTPAADVFRQIISGLGYELQMAPSIDAPVTLWISGVSARTALNVVCESLGCAWQVTGSRLVVMARPAEKISVGEGQTTIRKKNPGAMKLDLRQRFGRPLPVDMKFQDVPVSTILRAMSEVSGLEITAEEPLASQHVTLTGSGKTVEDALKAIIEQAGGAVARFTVSDPSSPGSLAMRFAIKVRPAVPKK